MRSRAVARPSTTADDRLRPPVARHRDRAGRRRRRGPRESTPHARRSPACRWPWLRAPAGRSPHSATDRRARPRRDTGAAGRRSSTTPSRPTASGACACACALADQSPTPRSMPRQHERPARARRRRRRAREHGVDDASADCAARAGRRRAAERARLTPAGSCARHVDPHGVNAAGHAERHDRDPVARESDTPRRSRRPRTRNRSRSRAAARALRR